MASHVFHEIYLHLNWHTKQDRPIITPDLEPRMYELIRQRCLMTEGVYLHGIGGTTTHVHVAINIEPHICISEFVGKLKGSSSHDLNAQMAYKALEWQRGYGAVSFSRSQLAWVLEYLANQKAHHARNALSPTLERCTFDEGDVLG